jgi:hypothetical protein
MEALDLAQEGPPEAQMWSPGRFVKPSWLLANSREAKRA